MGLKIVFVEKLTNMRNAGGVLLTPLQLLEVRETWEAGRPINSFFLKNLQRVFTTMSFDFLFWLDGGHN